MARRCLIKGGRITGRLFCYCCGGSAGDFWLWLDDDQTEAKVICGQCRPRHERPG